MRFSAYALMSTAAAALACSGAGENLDAQDDYSSVENAVVNATSTGGLDQAVMVYVKFNNNGSIGTRTCSGSYFTSRVVLTAAHCVENAFTNQVHVYYGNDFAADYAAVADANGFVVAPPPGEDSVFARADSFETHPDWDPTLVHPDMAVVYLDRELPFNPVPLARFKIDHHFVNKEATISGWGADTVTGPVSAIGSQVQRTGKTRILGSPTEADFHEDDPNPGMLDPEVREHVIKTDGSAPYSNGCFGDSGGPLLVKRGGKTYVAGVNYWTGLYCADYNLHTRVEPFLPFLDRAAKKAGREQVKPILDCVAPNADGTYTAYFGYDNQNGVNMSIPYGRRNKAAMDTQNRRPTEFAPGEHSFQFGVKFSGKQKVSYTLGAPHGGVSTVTASKHSRACGEAEINQIECGAVCDAQFASGCEVTQSFDSCMQTCLSNVQFFQDYFPDCKDEYSAYNACFASTPPGPENWICDPYSIAYSMMCGEQEMALGACLGY